MRPDRTVSATGINRCLNCGGALRRRFCHDCGQRERSLRRVFWSLVNETLDDVFFRDSRASHTLWCLIARPGMLTREYLEGKRARALSPVRLYLITSPLFFGVIALTNMVSNDNPSEAATQTEAQRDRTDWAAAHADIQSISAWEAVDPETRAWLIALLTGKLNRAESIAEEGGRAIVDEVLDIAPPVAFILLPLFALLLKLAYIRHDVYYAEHLVLALHNHSFLFLALTISIPLDHARETIGILGEALDSALELWILVYLFMSLKRTYRQSYPGTALKFALLGLGYLPLLLFGLIVGFAFGVLAL